MARLTFLGTGTSVGVPTIGCTCPVCTSSDRHDRRTRASAMVETGKEIVQIYSSVQQSNVPRPAKELKGFAKTKLLQPGESETLHIAIPKEELNYYDERQHGWKLASGTYTFHVGTNVNDIKGRLNVKID